MQSQESPIVIALTSREVFTTLSFYKLGFFGTVTFPFYIPAGGSITFSFPTPKDQVIILDVLSLYSTVDNVLDITVYVDNNVLLWDGSFNNSTYPPGGILFYDRGMVPVAYNGITIMAINTSSTDAYLYVRMEVGIVSNVLFSRLMKAYFEVVSEAISG